MKITVNQSRSRLSNGLLGLAMWMLAVHAVLAAPFSTDGIALDIPAGFAGPVMQNSMGSRVFAYSKQSLAPEIRTLLQITFVDSNNNAIPKTLTKDESSRGAEKYLLDFLQGIERRRTDFKRGNVAHLLLDETPAAKVSWRGNAQGIAVNGVMYCMIVSGRPVLFHTQDAGNEATANMREAIKAIEATQVK